MKVSASETSPAPPAKGSGNVLWTEDLVEDIETELEAAGVLGRPERVPAMCFLGRCGQHFGRNLIVGARPRPKKGLGYRVDGS
jgi:hypothetical protein